MKQFLLDHGLAFIGLGDNESAAASLGIYRHMCPQMESYYWGNGFARSVVGLLTPIWLRPQPFFLTATMSANNSASLMPSPRHADTASLKSFFAAALNRGRYLGSRPRILARTDKRQSSRRMGLYPVPTAKG
jgi:hypothetical protein